jgi:hypothetical protein
VEDDSLGRLSAGRVEVDLDTGTSLRTRKLSSSPARVPDKSPRNLAPCQEV